MSNPASRRFRLLRKTMRRILSGRPRRREPAKHRQGLADVTPATSAGGLDPVQLVTLALDRLGPATFRTATIGRPVEVLVPDEDTAAVFRAALARTQRSTDRLLTIVVASSPAG